MIVNFRSISTALSTCLRCNELELGGKVPCKGSNFMPLQEFALDPSGTKRIQIFQGNDPSNITVLLNGSIIGSISGREELASRKELTLKDGSILLVRYANNAFIILKDGRPLPAMSVQEIAACGSAYEGRGNQKRRRGAISNEDGYGERKCGMATRSNQ